VLYDWYRELIRLRKELPALRQLSKKQMEIVPLEHHEVIVLRRWSAEPLPPQEIAAVFNLSATERDVEFHLAAGRWAKLLDSAADRWHGSGETAPSEMNIDGTMRLMLRPWAASLWARE
jgi:maltooligosyltrehalose trehalohydrolase